MILHHGAQESGGVHFVGSSSTGKSTAQLVAASVYGSPSFKQGWRATGTGAGITGWQQGDAVAAAGTCFKSWLDSRGGGGNQERKAILSSVKAFFESHGESRFADITNDTNRVTINRAGFRKFTSEGQEYYVLPEAYNRDVCAGFDSKAVTKVLIEAGWLAPDEAGKSQQRKTLPEMGTTRCYVLTSKVWGD
jgi:putative DNA primase/helicase